MELASHANRVKRGGRVKECSGDTMRLAACTNLIGSHSTPLERFEDFNEKKKKPE
jgi:hypothetical protein